MAKRKNKEFQEKLLEAITAPVPVEAPELDKDYVDSAFVLIIKKIAL